MSSPHARQEWKSIQPTQHSDQSDLRELSRGVRRNGWIVATVVALAVFASLVRSSLQSELWSSTAVVRVLNASSTSALPDQNRVDPVREVGIQRLYANSARIREEVSGRLGPEAASIDSVRITGVATADAIQFRVTSEVRVVAQKAAQAYADVYVEARRRDIEEQVRARSDRLNQEITDVKDQIAGIDRRLGEIAPQVVVDFRGAPQLAPESEESKGLRANREALVARLADAQTQAEQLTADSSIRQNAIAVVAPADLPRQPFQPKPLRDAVVAFALGLFVGLTLALARSRVDDRIAVPADVEDLVPDGVAVVAIPHNPDYAKHEGTALLPLEERRSQEGEAFRALRTNLMFGRSDGGRPRRVLVTSPHQGDGKTTAASNLAASMALAGRQVVLIDCDLRRPRVHSVFGLPNDPGLVSVVRDGTPLQNALKTVNLADNQTLAVLPAGPVSYNPAELLMSTTVAAIVDKLAERYECVILDSSPLLMVADALPLPALTDGVILVFRAHKTRRREAREALAQLEQVSAHIVAVVVTQVRSKYVQYASYYGAAPTPPPHAPADAGQDANTSSAPVDGRSNTDRSTTKT